MKNPEKNKGNNLNDRFYKESVQLTLNHDQLADLPSWMLVKCMIAGAKCYVDTDTIDEFGEHKTYELLRECHKINLKQEKENG